MKSTSPQGFQYFFSILCRHVSHILKMCMKNYDDGKITFDKFTAFFNLVNFDHCLYTIMVGSAYFVKSTPPRAFSISFQYFADMFHTY